MLHMYTGTRLELSQQFEGVNTLSAISMHCNLLDLSAELQLMIIEDLLQDGIKSDLINLEL